MIGRLGIDCWRLAPRSGCLLLMVLAVTTSGCMGARINHFKGFSKAGVAYADAAAALTQAAAVASIDADSALLEHNHPKLDQAQRQETILEHNKNLKVRVALFGDLRRHAGILRSYFVMLAALSESDAQPEIGKSARGLADAAQKLGSQIKASELGSGTANFSEPAVKLTVAAFQQTALQKELEARANVIERELDLQQASLRLIAEEMKTDLQLMANLRETDLVRDFKGDNLPRSWQKVRREVLMWHPVVAAAEAAATAALNLRLSFIALVENRFDVTDLDAMLGDLDEVVDLVEKIHAARDAG